MDIICPAGWEVVYSAYDTLNLEHPDTWQMIDYIIYTGTTSEDFAEYVETSEVQSAKDLDMYVSHEAGPAIGSFTTMQVLCESFNVYYAWAPVGECWVFVTVYDFEGLTLDEALKPALEWVQLDKVL